MTRRCETQLNAAQRRAEVVRLRCDERLTFEEVGARLGVTKQRAFQIWAEALRTLPAPKLEQYRQEEIRFYDQMIKELLVVAHNPFTKTRDLGDIHNQLNKWCERKAKLLGLDSPVRRELNVITSDSIDREIQRLQSELATEVQNLRAQGIPIDDALLEQADSTVKVDVAGT